MAVTAFSSVTVQAHAKINLSLNVGKTRSDGFHEVAMILQEIELHDTVWLSLSGDAQNHLTVEFPEETLPDGTAIPNLPTDERNLAYRAALLMQEKHPLPPVVIHLTKRIPIAAGLAGGSTDAAGVLKGMNELFHLELPMEMLQEYGAFLGSDVPFCLQGGAAIATGRGEVLQPILGLKGAYVLLVKPPFGISTPWSYQAFREEGNPGADLSKVQKAMETVDLSVLQREMKNQLEKAALEAYPELKEGLQLILASGAEAARMTGSGPTLFGLFGTREAAERAKEILRMQLPKDYYLSVTTTI